MVEHFEGTGARRGLCSCTCNRGHYSDLWLQLAQAIALFIVPMFNYSGRRNLSHFHFTACIMHILHLLTYNFKLQNRTRSLNANEIYKLGKCTEQRKPN